MTSMSATAFRNDLYRTIDRVNDESTPITITNSNGRSAVLIGEDDWAAIEETLYLNSIPGMVESIKSSASEPDGEFVPESELDW